MCVYSSTYFQVVEGDGPISMGLQFFPFIIPAVIADIACAVLMKKTRYIKPYTVFGGVCGCVGYGCMRIFGVGSSRAIKTALLVLPAVSFATVFETSIVAAQLEAPKDDGTTILTTALFNFSRSLGGAVGGSLAQAVFNSALKNKLRDAVTENAELFVGLQQSDLTTVVNKPSLLSTLDQDVKEVVLQCIMDAIHIVFYMLTAATFVSLVASLFFSNKRIPSGFRRGDLV